MDNNLIIDDEYIGTVGANCKDRGFSGLEISLIQYTAILDDIKTYAIKDGDIHDAIDAYIECVNKISTIIANISDNMKNICDSFVTEIDEIDQYTF